jgi:hypothetical protein
MTPCSWGLSVCHLHLHVLAKHRRRICRTATTYSMLGCNGRVSALPPPPPPLPLPPIEPALLHPELNKDDLAEFIELDGSWTMRKSKVEEHAESNRRKTGERTRSTGWSRQTRWKRPSSRRKRWSDNLEMTPVPERRPTRTDGSTSPKSLSSGHRWTRMVAYSWRSSRRGFSSSILKYAP